MNEQRRLMVEAGDQAAALAGAGAESVRGLTCAAAVDMFPQDVYRVLGGLPAMTGNLPHLLQQLDTTLARQLQGQDLAVAGGTHVSDPFAAASHVHDALDLAANVAELLDLLAEAQQAIDLLTADRGDRHD